MSGLTINLTQLRAQATVLEAVLMGRITEAKAALHDAVRETGAETAEKLAARTFPAAYGFKVAADRMRFELSRLYATGGTVFQALKEAGEMQLAVRFYREYKSGNLAAAGTVLRQSKTAYAGIPIGPLDPSLHDKARNKSTGHIEVKLPWQIVPEKDLVFYKTLAIKRLGKTASGWSACAEQLGGDGNKPKWKGTAMHGSNGGHAQVIESDFGYHVVMRNLRPLARKHISPGQVARIKKQAITALQERMVKGRVLKALRNKRAA